MHFIGEISSPEFEFGYRAMQSARMEREIQTLQQSSKVLFGDSSPSNAAPLAMDWFPCQPVSDRLNLGLPIWTRVSNIRNRILSIDGPEADKVRVRRSVTRSGAHNRWKTPS